MSVGNQCVVVTIEIVGCTGDATIIDAVGGQEVTIRVDLYFDCVKLVFSQAFSLLLVDSMVLPVTPVAVATVESSPSSPRRKSGFLFLLSAAGRILESMRHSLVLGVVLRSTSHICSYG